MIRWEDWSSGNERKRKRGTLFAPFAFTMFRNDHFCQDRLGTNIGKPLKKGNTVLLAELDAMMGLMDKDGDGNIDYQEFVRVGQMKTELNDMQAKAQSDNQALAQELTNIAQEKCEAQISQLRQLLEDKTTRLSGTDQVRARERVRERKG